MGNGKESLPFRVGLSVLRVTMVRRDQFEHLFEL